MAPLDCKDISLLYLFILEFKALVAGVIESITSPEDIPLRNHFSDLRDGLTDRRRT